MEYEEYKHGGVVKKELQNVKRQEMNLKRINLNKRKKRLVKKYSKLYFTYANSYFSYSPLIGRIIDFFYPKLFYDFINK